MNIILYVFIGISLALLLPGIRIAKRNAFVSHPYPLFMTKGIAGYFSFCILVHHYTNVIRVLPSYNGELQILEYMGVLLVGFFFLFSGYGLIVSYKEKENYLDTFMIRRVCAVLIPFFICNYAYMITALLTGCKFQMNELILAFFGVILLNDHMWFAVEIMLLYLVFYFVFRYIKGEKRKYFLIGLFIIALMTFSFLRGHNLESSIQMNWYQGEWWYNTTPLFFLGMLLGKNRNRFLTFAQKHYIPLITISLIGFVGFWHATSYMLQHHGYWTETAFSKGYADKLMTLSVQLPMVIFFELFLLLLLMKIQFHNPALRFLGKISLELILVQNVFLLYFSDYLPIDYLVYGLYTIVFTVIVATLINKLKLLVLEKK